MPDPIWRRPLTLDGLNDFIQGCAVSHLGITFTAIGDDTLTATMPVDERTRQPYGLLHGGASVVLAETLGSMAGTCVVDPERFVCVGIEVNANHLRAVRGGTVTGTVRPVRLGRTVQVWNTDIEDDRGHLVCVSRLTLAVVERRDNPSKA